MSKPSFVYVTYIKSTADKVWRALTDGDITHQYWMGRRNSSDWKVGSEWKHQDSKDPSLVDIVGKVIENDRPNRLVVSWASPKDTRPEAYSRVTYEIKQSGPLVKLTVTHDQLEEGSGMAAGISKGWPMVLSSLKTFLETGEAIPGASERAGGDLKVLSAG
jgi:uncharacterized protein YndB with AHSA1/START domain